MKKYFTYVTIAAILMAGLIVIYISLSLVTTSIKSTVYRLTGPEKEQSIKESICNLWKDRCKEGCGEIFTRYYYTLGCFSQCNQTYSFCKEMKLDK